MTASYAASSVKDLTAVPTIMKDSARIVIPNIDRASQKHVQNAPQHRPPTQEIHNMSKVTSLQCHCSRPWTQGITPETNRLTQMTARVTDHQAHRLMRAQLIHIWRHMSMTRRCIMRRMRVVWIKVRQVIWTIQWRYSVAKQIFRQTQKSQCNRRTQKRIDSTCCQRTQLTSRCGGAKRPRYKYCKR